MRDCVVVHYGEIGTKGSNRAFFENNLVNNIKKKIDARVEREYGRIVVDGNPANIDALREVFGIAFFSPALRSALDIETIKEKALQLARESAGSMFAVAAKRSNKNFPLDSKQINEIVGKNIQESTGMRVDLTKPDTKIFIEVGEKNAYIYDKKIPGPGGLPVGASGTVVSLISGGIDSPVASYLMMKRGCRVVFVHFHNYMSKIEDKIESIVKVLSKYQSGSRLYLVPFFPLQERIIEKVPDRYRMIVYKRMMLRIAEKIAEAEGAKVLVTGDSLSQVASQTLENIGVIHSAVRTTVLSPLIGFDKNEIVKAAEKIGTYNLSIIPYQDCCTYMIARHPETRAGKERVEAMEKELDVEGMTAFGSSKAEIVEVAACK